MALSQPINCNSVLLAIIFLVITIPLVFRSGLDIFDESDEQNTHYPTVLQFAQQFPLPDVTRYNAATGPLHHIFLSIFARLFNMPLEGLRLINLLVSTVCLLVVYRVVAPQNPNYALLLAAAFGLSAYFIGAAVRISTDNAALLFAFLAIIALDQMPFASGKYLLTAILAALAFLTRQIYAWLIAGGVLNAWGTLTAPVRSRIICSLWYAIPAFFVLALLLAWRGLTPPLYQDSYQTTGLIHPRVIGYALAVLGQYGIFFLPWLWQFFRQNNGKWWHLIVVVAVSVVLLLIFPVAPADGSTVNNISEGGILWSVIGRLPVLVNSSLLFWALVPMGMLCLYAIFLESHRRKNYWVLLFSLMWLAANMLSVRVYQKYYEPYWLFFLAYSIRQHLSVPRWYWAFPALLCLILTGIALTRFYI